VHDAGERHPGRGVVDLTSLDEVGPTVAQRVRIGADPIVISIVRLTLSNGTSPPPNV
jgi:hypothetical protein